MPACKLETIYKNFIDEESPCRNFITPFKLDSFYNAPNSLVDETSNLKPKGLWYAQGSSWFDWCKSESFSDFSDCLYIYEIIPNYEKVLRISSENEFDYFEEKYLKKDYIFSMMDKIDWTLVSKEYSGIEIIPYLWRKRYDHFWYHGWDISSGCIWNATGIKEVKLIFEKSKKLWLNRGDKNEPINIGDGIPESEYGELRYKINEMKEKEHGRSRLFKYMA